MAHVNHQREGRAAKPIDHVKKCVKEKERHRKRSKSPAKKRSRSSLAASPTLVRKKLSNDDKDEGIEGSLNYNSLYRLSPEFCPVDYTLY